MKMDGLYNLSWRYQEAQDHLFSFGNRGHMLVGELLFEYVSGLLSELIFQKVASYLS
jgi:hypothetical protein